MIRHFTYEIDERNLRMRLKDLEIPLREGAWGNFDEFSTVQSRDDAHNGVKLKFSLNRNVVMLAIFGAVIISFSLLLFNFITIKNPKKENTQSLEENKAMAAEKISAPKKEVPPVVVKAIPIPTVAVKDTAVVKAEGIAEAKVAVPEPARTIEKAIEKPPVVEERSGEEIEAAEKKAEELRLKKEKRANAALAKKIKPAVITEDTDPDVAPQ